MKVAILSGGRGTRFGEETADRPKPMVEIGGKPILWHIMMHYAHFGFRDFVVALGYHGQYVRDNLPSCCPADWSLDFIDTGETTDTGGRVKRLGPALGEGTFMLTWGDGVSDLDLGELLAFHRAHGRLATVTAVRPPPRFGRLALDGDRVAGFAEKPAAGEGWINGAFFVLEAGALGYIDGDETRWEHEPVENLAADGQLMAFRHEGFWRCMDTARDRDVLEELWRGAAPWRVWEDEREGLSYRA